jgi:hypothetical protein
MLNRAVFSPLTFGNELTLLGNLLPTIYIDLDLHGR